jgi:hypothetical protein
MKAIVIALTFLLASCGGWTTEKEWVVYQQLCEKNGGIENLRKFLFTTLRCKNGAEYSSFQLDQHLGDKP